MTARIESDERYILDRVAEVLAEPDYRWQHRFATLLGDPGRDGKPRPLPVDGYFPRHRLVVEYWERQHSAPVPIMDEGDSISGVSRGHQRRLYDQRREAWCRANHLQFVILDYRGFDADDLGRLRRDPARDRQRIAEALLAAGVLAEAGRRRAAVEPMAEGCALCRLLQAGPASCARAAHAAPVFLWRGEDAVAVLHPFPVLFGQAVVAPPTHVERVTADLTLVQYLALQRAVYAVAEALRLELRPERVDILSPGSPTLGPHVQWHLVPRPPGLPPPLPNAEEDPLDLNPEELQALAQRLRSRLPPWMRPAASSS